MSNIEILEWMIEEYNKRGGGHSQVEALKEAISCMKSAQTPPPANDVVERFKEEFSNKPIEYQFIPKKGKVKEFLFRNCDLYDDVTYWLLSNYPRAVTKEEIDKIVKEQVSLNEGARIEPYHGIAKAIAALQLPKGIDVGEIFREFDEYFTDARISFTTPAALRGCFKSWLTTKLGGKGEE